ncbi:MAG TPA: sulfatase-like hydrolase/transferase [Bacteroidales bacterium]|jgi:arylsulfatase A-like enzyme|nr:sulfatase-like hydrolase/transferase [Bacteroidales bacterium]HOS72546.1 sulfatase-like hydrolase/transferase [Bacteroidales bacterium]HQH25071.1 sulfatase-like hydrolase/transferase [Bacteroidales bacterium]HQJ82729.1 sulfatase-like hydrolase/transferase [Bacteroidales bacterium]
MNNLQLLTGCICGISVLTSVVSCRRDDGKPNVLVIFTDDQRADALGCSGNRYIRTPNIDNLAGNGVRFLNCYVMGGHHGAISAPSRAMLLSGKYLFNVYDRLDGVKTMPMHFAEHGYVTFGTGKWHNEKSAFEASFQKGRNIYLGGMADHFNIPVCDLGDDGKLSEPVYKGFSTDIIGDAAMEFIRDYADGDRKNPFFCYVAFTAPHDPFSPREDYIDMYSPASVELPGNFLPLHPFAFDDLMVRDELLTDWPRDPQIIKSILADYYGLISHLDAKVGEIIRTLKEKGLYENTIIVYAADNGLALGSHGLIGKQNLYEHSMNVPFIIAGPGVPEGKISDALVYLLDIYPTLTGLAHIPFPEGTDGENLVPVITRESKEVRSSLFTAYRNTVRAVRTKEWKLIRYPELDKTQLFNLANDPLETDNLAEDETFAGKTEALLEIMKKWQQSTGDTVPLTAREIKPSDYDYRKLVRKPDRWQPEYTLKKYFGQDGQED